VKTRPHDTARDAGGFRTLTAAIAAAGLEKILKDPGPFTMFAPTDEAFKKLPPGALDALLKDKAKLGAVLACHVVTGKLSSGQVAKLEHATTLQGADVVISRNGGVRVDRAHVVKADIEASNGIIHGIDEVILSVST